MSTTRTIVAAGALALGVTATAAAAGADPPARPAQVPDAVDVSLDIVAPSGELTTNRRRRYRLVVRNDGDGEAQDVTVVITLPRGVRHVRGGEPDGRTVTFTKAKLGAGKEHTFKLVVRVGKVKRVRLRGTVTAKPPPAATPPPPTY